jgi:hypothetical protein
MSTGGHALEGRARTLPETTSHDNGPIPPASVFPSPALDGFARAIAEQAGDPFEAGNKDQHGDEGARFPQTR